MVICSNLKMNCIRQDQKEKCSICSRTLNTWIHFDGSERILCYDCAEETLKDIDQNSTEYETRQLLQDVREFPALRECKKDSFLKKYFTILSVVFAMLVYTVFGAFVTRDEP